MPGEKNEKLKIGVETEGAEQSSKQLGQVADAQAKLTDGVEDGADRIEKAADAQGKLNASESDFISLLTQIDPVLGRIGDGLLKGGKVAGEFATAEIGLGESMELALSAMKAQASTLKLLGAASGVGLAFLALSKAISSVREESQKLREELDALKAEKTTEEEQLIAGQHDVTRLSKQRREGGFSASEEAEAQRIFKTVAESGVVKDIELFKKNLAALLGLVSAPDIEKLTLAGFSSELGLPASARGARAAGALRRDSTEERSARERERVSAERRRRAQEALKELQSDDPLEGLANLNEFIDQFGQGLDPDAIKDLVKRALALKASVDQFEKAKAAGNPLAEIFLRDLSLNAARDPTIANLIADASKSRAMFSGLLGSEDTQITQNAATKLLQALLQLSEDIKENTAQREPTIVNNNQGQRITFPDGASQRRAIRNGRTIARERER